MFVLLTAMLAAPPVTTSIVIELEDVRTGETAVLSDGQTVIFLVQPAGTELEDELAAQLPRDANARVTPLPRSTAEIEIASPDPVVTSRVSTGPAGAVLVIEVERRADAVRRRAQVAVPRSVPSVFVGPRVREAEAALSAGLFADARERFTGMTREYSLRSWAQLRLADLALISGDVEEACAGYRGVVTEFPQRTAGLVGRMRLHGLECLQRETVTLDWGSLVARLQRVDGPVGAYLLREAASVLQLTRDPAVVRSALAISAPGRRATRLKAPPKLRHALLARALRHGAPFDVSHVCFAYDQAIARHAENRLLLLTCARAALALDLPDTALTYLDRVDRVRGRGEGAAVWESCRGPLQELHLRAAVYAAAGRTYLSRRASDRYAQVAGEPPPATLDPEVPPPVPEVARAAAGLEARIDALRAHYERSLP